MIYTPKCHYHRTAVLNLPKINFIFLILIAIFGVVYLFQINFMVSGGFKMRDLEQTIQGVRKNAKQLQLETLELQSMHKIRQGATELGLVPIGRAKYIKAGGSTVALK